MKVYVAPCAGQPEALFFPPPSGNYEAGKAICRRCETREQCLADTLAFEREHRRYGLFGGLTPDERAALDPRDHRKVRAPRDACRRGHPYAPETTYVRRDGYRRCLVCKQMEGSS